jgi:hypothetical protein
MRLFVPNVAWGGLGPERGDLGVELMRVKLGDACHVFEVLHADLLAGHRQRETGQ